MRRKNCVSALRCDDCLRVATASPTDRKNRKSIRPDPLSMSSKLWIYYYTCSTFALISGVSLDRTERAAASRRIQTRVRFDAVTAAAGPG